MSADRDTTCDPALLEQHNADVGRINEIKERVSEDNKDNLTNPVPLFQQIQIHEGI